MIDRIAFHGILGIPQMVRKFQKTTPFRGPVFPNSEHDLERSSTENTKKTK